MIYNQEFEMEFSAGRAAAFPLQTEVEFISTAAMRNSAGVSYKVEP